MTNSGRPKVSVVIAAWNNEEYIGPCLDSVLSQSLRDLEVICVDDGSADGTGALLDQYAKKDNRLRVIHQENRGAGAARNAGLAAVSGEYLSFLDGDDFFDPFLLEKCVALLEKEHSDIVVYSALRWDTRTGQSEFFAGSLDPEHLPARRPFRPSEMAEYLFTSFRTWAWNKMFRADFVREKNLRFQEISRTNDMAFTFSALVQAEAISVLEEPLVSYRVGTDTSLQSTCDRDPSAFWAAYTEVQRNLSALGLYRQYERSFLNCILQGSLYNLNAVKTADARLYIRYLLKYEAEKQFGFLAHPREYYDRPDLYDEYVLLRAQPSVLSGETQGRIAALEEDNRVLREQLSAVRGSSAFRVGKLLLLIPHKLRNLFRRDSSR